MSDGRVRVTHAVTLVEGAQEAFLQRYGRIRELAMSGRFAGHVSHQLCRGVVDDDQWLITSEWLSEDAYDAWERDPVHREATMPLRELFAEAGRPRRYLIVAEDVH